MLELGAMKKLKPKQILVLGFICVMLVAAPLTVRSVLNKTMSKSRADIGGSAAYSHRISPEDESSDYTQPFHEKYLPEIAAGVIFVSLLGVLMFTVTKSIRNEGN